MVIIGVKQGNTRSCGIPVSMTRYSRGSFLTQAAVGEAVLAGQSVYLPIVSARPESLRSHGRHSPCFYAVLCTQLTWATGKHKSACALSYPRSGKLVLLTFPWNRPGLPIWRLSWP